MLRYESFLVSKVANEVTGRCVFSCYTNKGAYFKDASIIFGTRPSTYVVSLVSSTFSSADCAGEITSSGLWSGIFLVPYMTITAFDFS